MKLLPFILLLSSCATRIDSGNTHFVTYSNAAHISFVGHGISFEATGLNNSGPTRSALYGASHLVSAAATAALPFAGGPAVIKAAPVIPAVVPAFRINPSSQ